MPRKLTTEEFITKARAVHGDKYDYSKSVYSGYRKKLLIRCPLHTVFPQSPDKHIDLRRGCPRCADLKRASSQAMTQEEFIRRSTEKHKGFYNYDLVSYVNANTKVIIRCPKHDTFEQRPSKHMSGEGCDRCADIIRADKKRMSLSEFIKKARNKHGGRYDYSLVSYQNYKIKVKIICPDHEIFEQTPNAHLRGSGCRKCGLEKFFTSRVLTTEEFVERSKCAHDTPYDYTESVYLRSRIPVTIICPFHGRFRQAPEDHMNGKTGCLACINRAPLRREEYLKQIHALHGDRYRYNLPPTFKASDRIEVICSEHKEFHPTAGHHARGSNCGHCMKSVKITDEMFFERALEKHGSLYDYSKVRYQGMHKHIIVGCFEHKDFIVTPSNFLNYGCGCPSCNDNLSSLERRAADFFIEHDIDFVAQWRHPDCRDIRPLPFDFLLPALGALVELDGQQHFKPVKWGSSISDKEAEAVLFEIQKRDQIKTNWAISSGRRIIRIRFDESVEERLAKAFIN